MPQLIPFYFTNQFIMLILTLTLVIVFVGKKFIPNNTFNKVARSATTNL